MFWHTQAKQTLSSSFFRAAWGWGIEQLSLAAQPAALAWGLTDVLRGPRIQSTPPSWIYQLSFSFTESTVKELLAKSEVEGRGKREKTKKGPLCKKHSA